MKRFLTKIFVYGFVIFVLLNIISFLSLFFLANSNFYKQQFVVNGVKEKSFDYVVLGSSTGLTTLDTKLIDSIAYTKGLNISMDDSSLNSHYLMLQHFYNSGKTTNKLVLAVRDHDMKDMNPQVGDNDYRFLPHIQNEDVFNHFKNDNQESLMNVYTISKYFPLVGVSYFNTELFYPSLQAFIKPKYRNRFDDRGNYTYPISTPKVNQIKEIEQVVIDVKNPYFFKIHEFCKERNIDLIVYVSPVYKKEIVFDYDNVINHSDLLQDSKYFYDNIHVNSIGRKECSIEFAKVFQP